MRGAARRHHGGRNASYGRQTEQIGFRQWHVTSVLTRWQLMAKERGPGFVTGGRKRTQPLISQLKWTGNVPLVPCRFARRHRRHHRRRHHHHHHRRHRRRRRRYYCRTTTAITTIALQRQLCATGDRERAVQLSQSVRRVQTAALYRCLARSALLDMLVPPGIAISERFIVPKIRRDKISTNQRACSLKFPSIFDRRWGRDRDS